MAYLELEDVKRHLNIDLDYAGDDEYLLSLVDTAEEVVSQHICSNLNDMEVDGKLPSPLLHAMKLLIGTYYSNRESVTEKSVELPHGYYYLVRLYRQYYPK